MFKFQIDLDITPEQDELVVSATSSRLDIRDPKVGEGSYWLLDRDGPLWRSGLVCGPLDMDAVRQAEASETPADVTAIAAAWRAA
jgi:hypothetical protein